MHVRGIADEQVLLDHDAGRAQLLDLLEQRFGVDDHAVAEEAELVRMDDARGDQPQCEVLVGELHRVPGVVAALIPSHDVEALAEKIDDLPLSFISPLRADDGDIVLVHGSKPGGD